LGFFCKHPIFCGIIYISVKLTPLTPMSSKQVPKLVIFLVFSAIISLVGFIFVVRAQTTSPDAIAIRVIPNPDHVSAARWFKEKKFSGSPQSLLVDGYRAVRDGRTVYANVANVDGSELYTNIYLISYNQSAEQATTDMFAQMLKHWKFNTNYSDPGTCKKASTTKCLIDSDCANDDYCLSDKAEVIRDTTRLEDIADMKASISAYKTKNGSFPAVNSGSYLPNTVISTWPSWQKVLSQTLGSNLPSDPVNSLGDCGGANYNAITCWDESAKKFADSKPSDPKLNLPDASRAYLYVSDAQGLNYSLCSVMESGYITDITEGACDGSAEYIIEDRIDNRVPVIEGENNLVVCGTKEFKAYFSGTDPDGDKLTWTLDASPASQWSSWPSAPVMKNTAVPGMKEVYAPAAGLIGNYSFKVIAGDGKGPAQEFTQNISVTDCVPPVIAKITNVDTGAVLYLSSAPAPFTITSVIGRGINLLIEASDTESSFPLSFNFTGIPSGFNSTGSLDANNHDYHVAGVVEDRTKKYMVSLSAEDKSGAESKPPISFTIDIINNPPAITSAPAVSTQSCVNYSYNITATEPDSHSFAYLNSGSLPLSLAFNAGAGLLSGYVRDPGTYPISLSAQDGYFSLTDAPSSALSTQTYNLTATPENFSITSNFDVPTVPVVYAVPFGVPLAELYHGPFTFMATADANAALGGETWSQSHTAVPASTTITINPVTGLVNASAFDSVVPPAGIPVTVTLKAANICGTEKQKNFNLTLRPNEWCGDGLIQGGSFGETCEGSNLDSKTCVTQGFSGGNLLCNSDCAFNTSQCCNNSCSPSGSRTCSGTYDYFTCGNYDSDPCFEWNTVAASCGTTNCTAAHAVGSCSRTCSGSGTCDACTPTCACVSGWSNCDGDWSNGCETSGSCGPIIGVCGVYFSGWLLGSPFYTSWFDSPFLSTTHSNWVANGDYPSNSTAFPEAVATTFDGIAIDKNTHLEMWTGSGASAYTGTKLLDVWGPRIINDTIYYSDAYDMGYYSSSCFGLNTTTWPTCEWSSSDMQLWSTGSSKITCE
jgi:hypothetical protein